MTSEFVLDASVALSRCFEDEVTPYTENVLDLCRDGSVVHVPSIWALEISNALVMAQRRGRVTEERAEQFAAELFRFEMRIDAAPDEAALVSIRRVARAHRLTAYDSAYLELALRKNLPLPTMDSDLRNAAISVGVALLETASSSTE